MSNEKQKPIESMLVTADMPTDYIATNGYEYVLKSKYQSLEQQAEKLLEALEKIKNRGCTPEKEFCDACTSADAVADYKKFKGEL